MAKYKVVFEQIQKLVNDKVLGKTKKKLDLTVLLEEEEGMKKYYESKQSLWRTISKAGISKAKPAKKGKNEAKGHKADSAAGG